MEHGEKAEETCTKTTNNGHGSYKHAKIEESGSGPLCTAPESVKEDYAYNGRNELAPATTQHHTPSTLHDEDDDDFPEGGLQAWLVVFGCWCAMFMVFGVVNSTAAFQEYFSSHQLRDHTPGQIGWIFSMNLFLVFFCGIYVGKIFDAYDRGPLRIMIGVGSMAIVLSMVLLSFCTEYWHFMLDYGVLGGLGGALLNPPAYAAIGHFFKRRCGFATGIACTSGSLGGIIIPFMLQALLPKIGFAWSTRVLGLLLLVMAIPANLFVTKRLPPDTKELTMFPDLTSLKDPKFALCTIGVFLMEWGLFVPIAYISSYTTSQGLESSFGFTVLALLNVGSFFGRLLPGFVADRIGRFNIIIVTIALCVITVLGIWLPAGDSKAVIIVFAISFGFASGSNLGLLAVCVSQLCKVEDYGRYFATCYSIASLGTLTSIPIGGELLGATGGQYWGVVTFAGLAYAAALACYTASRVLGVGWNPKTFY